VKTRSALPAFFPPTPTGASQRRKKKKKEGGLGKRKGKRIQNTTVVLGQLPSVGSSSVDTEGEEGEAPVRERREKKREKEKEAPTYSNLLLPRSSLKKKGGKGKPKKKERKGDGGSLLPIFLFADCLE